MTETARNRVSIFAFGAILFFAVALVYSRTVGASFIWDDESHLTQNPVIIGPLGFTEIWTSARAVYYPLVLTTFWVLHKLVGLQPIAYHILNIAWHAASALLLWRVLIRLRVRGAWLGAAIWALHPVMVQSVAWVTEMKNTESGFFYLLTILLFLRSRDSVRARLFYFFALLSFAAAITGKPSTVMLPLVLGLCLWWINRILRSRDCIVLAPFLLISLAASGWTIWEQKFHAGAAGAEWVQAPLQRLLVSSDAIWFYLFKLLWPHPLIFIYPRWNIDTSRWINYFPMVSLVIIALVLFIRRDRELRPVFFAFAYFVLMLFPVLDFFDVYFFRYSFVSDHFQYLASMGPLVLAGAIIATSTEMIARPNLFSAAVASTIVIALGLMSFYQTAKYHDLVSLYQATLAQNPRCWMAEYNLGLALRSRGDLDGSITHYQRAIEIRPDYVEAHYNLAGALIDKGDISEALAHYHRAIEIKPEEADSHNNYGSALRQLAHLQDAEAEYRRALRLQPDYLDAALNLADLLLQSGRSHEAIEQLTAIARLQPESASIHARLGNALMKQGQAKEAAEEFSRALAIAPNDVPALNSFAWLLATTSDDAVRDGSKAVQLAERANNIRAGQDPLALHSLAAAYAAAGNFSKAIAAARSAIELARQHDNQALTDALHDEISLYELGYPYRQRR